MSFLLEALTIMIFGFIFLRIAGKKVIAEMTPLEMVTVLATGTIIGHAVSEQKLWATVITIGVFVGILIVFQYISLKWQFFHRLIIGKPTLVIRDGVILKDHLAKLRMPVEQLEMRIRQQGISHISDIRTATIEVNGQLGYELIESARPVTRGELEQILKQLNLKMAPSEPKKHDVFDQIRKSMNLQK